MEHILKPTVQYATPKKKCIKSTKKLIINSNNRPITKQNSQGIAIKKMDPI